MSGMWKRNDGKMRKSGTVKAKLAETDCPNGYNRATSRRYTTVMLEIDRYINAW